MASRGVDPYGASVVSGGNRSPRPATSTAARQAQQQQQQRAGGGLYSTGLSGELPTVDRSPSRGGAGSYGPVGPYSQPGSARGSPVGRRGAAALAAATGRPHISRSSNSSPLLGGDHGYYTGGGGYAPSYGGGMDTSAGPYYGMQDDLLGMDAGMDRRTGAGGSSGHHRSRSVSRSGAGANPSGRYGSEPPHHEREFVPIREPRERSLDRGGGGRERSLDRGMYMEDELYGPQSHRSARQSPSAAMMGGVDRGGYIGELTLQNNDLQRELANLKKELELTSQKLGSSMHSIKTFWSPELKKERALRKEESAKYSLINDQLKLLNSENQKQAMLVRQLEEELRMRMRNPSIEMQQQMEALFTENEHLTREITILRETIKELELRIETQKQTLQARDESIKKLLEMLQNKGIGKEEERQMFQQMQAVAQKQLDEFRTEISRRDQELLAVSAKMKTLEEQHQDYQRHIAVLKESLCAKEEHYNMLQADCEELRQRLEEKNRLIEKKTQAALQATQERNRIGTEVNELRDHMDIKDRKINVLQRKMELYDANQKLSSGAAQGEAEAVAQRKQLEEQRRRLEEHRRQLDTKVKQLDEKEKALAEVDQKLKKRKDKMDQLEAQMQKQQQQQQQQMQSQQNNQQGMQQMQQQLQQVQQERQQLQQQLQQQQQAQQQGNQERQKMQGERQQLQQQVQQLQQEKQKMQQQMQQAGAKGGANPEIEKELAKTRDDAKRAQDEMERLLKLVQMSQEEQNQKEKTIMELQNALKNAQAKLKTAQQAAHQAEEESTDFVQIEELQEALRESVRLTVAEEQRRNELTEKVGRLERRLRSLQSARALRCPTCRPLLCRVPALQQRLDRLLAERRSHLEDLVRMKQEALEAALSEKDAHLALLEMSGVRTARQADQLERLRADRARLTQRLQAETEQAARMLATYALTPENEVETGPPSHVLLDVLLGEIGDDHEEEDFEEDRNADFADNVEPDSLDESSSPRTSVARTSK